MWDTHCISTTAHDENNGNEFLAGDSMKVTDTVSYSNLSSDETYVLSGTLMDKATGKAIKDANGNEVTGRSGGPFSSVIF